MATPSFFPKDFFTAISQGFVLPKEVWLPAAKGKGLEVQGTFSRKPGNQMFMELTFTNRAAHVTKINLTK